MTDFFLDDYQGSVHSSQYAILTTAGSGTPVSAASASSGSTKTAAPAESGEVAKIFEKLKGIINEDIVKGTNAVFQFEVKGKVGQVMKLAFSKTKDGVLFHRF